MDILQRSFVTQDAGRCHILVDNLKCYVLCLLMTKSFCPYVGFVSICILDLILQRGWKPLAFFSHTSGCGEDQAPGTEKSIPKGYVKHTFMELPIALAEWINQYDHISFLFFKCLLGKCFVYCNGLMDHICVCENGNSKAWYKAPGHFSGTLVNRSYTICITIYENMNRAAQSSCISVQTVKNRN